MRFAAQAQVQGGGTKNAWPDEEVYEAVKTALTRLRKEIDEISHFNAVETAGIARSAELTAAAVQAVQAASDDLAVAKHEAGLLGFDDLLVQTRNVLRDSPLTRRETAASVAALLVDEFQDTDPIQAEIVEALAGDGLEKGKLFVVGDAKQSIYRFRRADPSVFDAMRERIPNEGRLPLTTNFRSQPEILKFVNALFAPCSKRSMSRWFRTAHSCRRRRRSSFSLLCPIPTTTRPTGSNFVDALKPNGLHEGFRNSSTTPPRGSPQRRSPMVVWSCDEWKPAISPFCFAP